MSGFSSPNRTLAALQGTPGNPTGTTSTGGVMAGLTQSITPVKGTRVRVTIDGYWLNTSANAGAQVTLYWGTGTAPANGAAATGNALGPGQAGTATGASTDVGFSITRLITGLTPGVTYWLDLLQSAVTTGTASLRAISVVAEELSTG